MGDEKPFLNLSADAEYKLNDDGAFKENHFSIGDKIGAQKLGYGIVILDPGFKACPFHNHHINEEMFLVIEGEGTLRFGEKRYQIKKDDIIACPPGCSDVAHQIINTGSGPLKYLCVGTNEAADICEYPDSNKVLSMAGKQGHRSFSHLSRLAEKVDYFEGES